MPRELSAKLEEVRASRSIEGERRIVTILFCDVKGSSAIAEKLDPEDWAKIMNGGYSFLIESVYRYEGTVAQLMGDAILAFFGAPIAHEDDAQRAILAALEIIKGVEQYGARVRREYEIDYQVRVGINTGLVVVGNIGNDLKFEYLAMGDAINLAARLQTAAEPSSVLISDNTYRLVTRFFEFEDRGKLEVKGKVEPVQVYQVIGERKGPISPRGVPGLFSALVGRQRELTALMQTIADLRAGRGSTVSILGEAGLGKSRLVAEWRKHVVSDDSEPRVRWVEGRCLSYSTSVAHHLNIAILRELIGAPDTSEVETRRALRRLSEQLFGAQMLEIYAYLGHLLGLQLEEDAASRVRNMSGPTLLGNYVSAYKRLLQTLAQANPIVIVSEDVHWADPSSVGLGLQLLSLVAESPIVFVFVMRPETDAPAWKFVAQSHEIPGAGVIGLYLSPLSESDSRQLVSNLLSLETLPESLRELVRSTAEGNPFFTEEVIRMLIDRGVIARENKRWVMTRALHTIEIPDTLQGILLARIDRLPEGAKRSLQIASVIGRRFQERVLARILGRDQTLGLQSELSTLESSGLIRLAQEKPEREYMARHVLIQEAAYSSMLKQDRKQLHAAVGQALEQLYPERLDEYAPILEQHFAEANNVQKTFDYAARAGDSAARVYAHTEARLHYDKALEALTHLDDNDENRRRRLDVTIKLVSVSALAESPERNLARLTEVEPIAQELATKDGSPADRLRLARVHYWIGRSHYYRGQSREALGYYQKVLAEAQGLGDDDLLAIPLSNVGQVAAMVQGRYGKAAPLLERAIPLLERSGDTTEWLRAFTYAAIARTARGEFAEGLANIQEALARAQAARDLTNVGFTQLALVMVYTRANDSPKLLAAAKAAVEAAEQSGNLLHAYIAYGALAWAQGRLGDFANAEANFAKSDSIGEKLGNRLVIADQLAAGKAEVAWRAGKVDDALALSERAVTLAKAVGSVYSEGLAERVWGQALAALEPPRWDEAEAHLATSVQALEAADDLVNVANTQVEWGKIAHARGEIAGAREHLERAAAQFEKSRLANQLESVRRLLSEL